MTSKTAGWIAISAALVVTACHDRSPTMPEPPGRSGLFERCTVLRRSPTGGCEDEGCISPGLERRVFDEWKEQVLVTHRLSEDQFTARVKLTDVEINGKPPFVWVGIESLFVLDWVRAERTERVTLGEFPPSGDPGAREIAQAVQAAIRDSDSLGLPGVVSIERMEAAFQGCVGDRPPNSCHVRVDHSTGALLVSGDAIVNYGGNQCIYSTINLATGEVVTCEDSPYYLVGDH